MKSALGKLTLALLGAALGTSLAACGEDGEADDGASQSDLAPVTEAPDDPPRGGSLEVLAAEDVDFLDPGAAYYQFSYMVLYPMHRPLFSYEPDTVSPSPDLARRSVISKDERTVRIEIRDDVRFSPPVDRRVTSEDVEYAIERGLMPGVANGYIDTYFSDLKGYEAAQRDAARNETVAPDISGVSTPGDRVIVFKLDKPVVATLLQALSLPLSSPVPEEYAKKFDAKTPSRYGQNAVFTGPYMVENDRSGGLVGYDPGRRIHMVRNPNWRPKTDYRPAYLDEILVNQGFENVPEASARILEGESRVNGDIVPTPPVLEQAATEFSDQLQLTPSGANRYVALNTTVPPFDDPNVRKAVVAGFDREALHRARGGELAGEIASHFIPPDIPGFEEAGGVAGPNLDFLATPAGDPDLAADLFREAGYERGEYQGKRRVLMVAEKAGVDRRVGELAREQLEELGFRIDFRQVGQNRMFAKFCDVPRADVAVCPNVGWSKDFNDPQTILNPTFNGDNIRPTNNVNWPQLDVPKINKAMDRAKLINDPDRRAKAWGEIDRMVSQRAPAVPYLWDLQPSIASANVNNVVNRFTALTDLSFTTVDP